MWWKVLLTVWLMSVAMPGANAQMGGSSYEMMYPEDPEPDPNCDCDVDMMILVDGSSSVGRDAFQLARDYIAHLIECFNCTNVGLLYCKCESKICIPFCVYDNIPDLITAVGEVPYFNGSKTRVGHCIYHAQCTTNWREGVPDVIVVLSDGQIYGTYEWGYYDDVASYAQNARDAGITIYAAGIGRDGFINQTGLEVIAGDDSRVVDTANEDPSWLVTTITIEQCGTCIQLVKVIEVKRPYPWEEDAGPNEGECSFESRYLQQVCQVCTTSGCSSELETYYEGLQYGILDIWEKTKKKGTEFLEKVKKKAEELIEDAKEVIDAAEDVVREGFEGAIDGFWRFFNNTKTETEGILGTLTTFVIDIKQNIQDIICQVVGGALIDAISELFEGLVKVAFDVFCHVLDGLVDAIKFLLNNLGFPIPQGLQDFLNNLLAQAEALRFLKRIARIFGQGLGGLLCRFLWWLIRPFILPFIYPVPLLLLLDFIL